MNDAARRAARELAVNALARREHSRHELEAKLAARGLGRNQIELALDELAAAGLQNDQRYADAYLRSRAERGYGPRRITAELRQRGVSDEVVGQALAASELDWTELASLTRRKKFRGQPRVAAERARQIRFLEYRGYHSAQIRQALGLATSDEDL